MKRVLNRAANDIDNIQQITDAVQKGLKLVLRAINSFQAVFALSCGPAKCQCCITMVTL